MLQHKKTYILCLLLALFFISSAKAGLYGIDEVNPYTAEEDQKDRGFPPRKIVNYRQEMRRNINLLSRYAKLHQPDFQIILHGDDALLSKSEIEVLTEEYNRIKDKKSFVSEEENIELLENIAGFSFANVICGETPFSQLVKDRNLVQIYIEKCSQEKKINKAIEFSILNKTPVYLFAERELAFKSIKGELIIKENSRNVMDLKSAKNISILIDDSQFSDKHQMLEDISKSNYDIVIMKPLFHDKIRFTKQEINSLKLKKNGAKRLIIAEMNLSEINPKDYYFQEEWLENKPSWISRESFTQQDAMIVEYWNSQWRKMLSKHFKSIMDIGFDGAWLTGIENYQYFEKLTPLI